MSINFNRAYYNKAQIGNHVLRYKLMQLYPPYWDDGVMTYPRYRRGYKNPNKALFSFQVREYRTWKHNRKKQYHNIFNYYQDQYDLDCES